MDQTCAEGKLHGTNNHPAKNISEFMNTYFQSLRAYKALIADDEIYNKVINKLILFAENKPALSSPPISITGTKDVTIDVLKYEDLIENEDYHHNPHKPIIHLHRFMTVHKVDLVRT